MRKSHARPLRYLLLCSRPSLHRSLRIFQITKGCLRMEMIFVWLARLMFLGVFLMAGGMLFRAWRIAVRKDMRHVADWRGRQVTNGEQWAASVLSINLVAAGILLAIGISVLVTGLAFTVWTGLSALVLWSYYFLLRIVVARAENEPKS